MEEFTQILGILGAYIAILLVLAVSVETILEPISWFKGLRRKLSPDDAMKDIKEWLPKDPAAATSNAAAIAAANAIANLTMEYKVVVDEVDARVKQIKEIAAETATGLGITKPVADLETKLAVYMAALRAKYAVDERTRIIILRLLSAVVGIAIALFLRINTFDLLCNLFPVEVRDVLSSNVGMYGGMVLTGLAASAGSGFWHDMLGKMRAVKESVNQVQTLAK